MDFSGREIVLIVGLGAVVGFGIYMFVTPISPDWKKAEIVSRDPDISSFEPFYASNVVSQRRRYNWTFGVVSAGPWKMRGFGGRAPANILFGSSEPEFILHPWNPGDWQMSNISQTLTVPKDAEHVRAFMTGRDASYLLYNTSNPRFPECADTKMMLFVFSDGESLNKTEIVQGELETLTLDITDYTGETVKILGGVIPADRECPSGFNWLHIEGLGVEAISG
ncbi:MAG: hypothetical protein ABEJ83_02205 [Candidatus Nanohaloarchaea archaeon]